MRLLKILLLDVGSKAPNLALMKISAYHKALGNHVGFDVANPDKVCISCPFPSHRSEALGLATMFNGLDVEVGGYGVSNKQLPCEIEHIMPDYSLYGLDHSIGFTSRGCIRSCSFCIVPKMEGKIRDHAPISEFLHPCHKKLILYDNNFLASPRWKENIEEVIDRRIKVSFNAGLDIRLINDENARLLSQVKYFDDQFKTRRLYFSFDLPEIKGDVEKGIKTLKNCGIKPGNLMFYVLVGFNTNLEQDLDRINFLKEQKTLPYVMRYKKTRKLNALARWVNRCYYNFIPFSKYRAKNLRSTSFSLHTF